MSHGCFNRKPYAPTTPVQDGWYMDGYTRTPRMVPMPFRMSTQCEYRKTSLGEADKNCAGCGWRNPQQQPTKEIK